MEWWQGVLELFKVGVAAKTAKDQRDAAEELQARQIAAQQAAAKATTAAQQQAFQSETNAAKMAYASLTSPGSLASAPSAPSAAVSSTALDAYLPMIVIGVVALGAFTMLRK